MIGLIIKDVLNLNSNKRIFISLLIMFIFLGFFDQQGASLLSIYLPILCLMLAISTFSYDEYSKWDRYVLALPLDRKSIVVARYLFSMSLLVLSYILIIVLKLTRILLNKSNIDLYTILFEPLITIFIIVIFLAIILPIIYKFGAEKGRMIMILVSVIIGSGGFIVNSLIDDPNKIINITSGSMLFLQTYGFYILAIVSVIFFFVSYRLSLMFYAHKEL